MALGVLHGNFAGALDEKNRAAGNREEQNELDDEHHKAACAGGCAGHAGNELIGQGVGQTGDDTDKDDEGDTVADTAVGYALAEPHDEHRACSEDNRQVGDCPAAHADHRSGLGGGVVELVLEVEQIGGTLHAENHYGEVAGILREFLVAAFAFALHLLEAGKNHAEELNHDGRSNVGHDTQGEDGGVGEGAAGEHVEQLHQAARVSEFLESHEVFGIDARQHDVTAESVHEYQQDCYEDALTQFLNGPDVFECLKESHWGIGWEKESYLSSTASPPAASMAAFAAAEKALAWTLSLWERAPLARILTSSPLATRP